ncbi:hypothetical protein DL93DRAFT_2089317 [Clavulina sp. PMI_390]|nr:hypothetical protein DL93DRAFT_2089317 [Clavulina sp. PMI_390]
MGLQFFCSNVRGLVDQLERLGETGLSALNQKRFSPHTRLRRAEAVSNSLSHSERLLMLVSELLKQTQSLHDSLRVEQAVAANSVCPVLQMPDEILRMIFLICAAEEDHHPRPAWLVQVCRQWRSNALDCPELWATIDPADSIHVLQQSLQRSSNLPLRIHISRSPPRNYRKQEKGSIQSIIREIQRCEISRLSVMAEALCHSGDLDLYSVFGRDSELMMLPAKTIHVEGGTSTFSENPVNMVNVEFPRLEVLELDGCPLPLLDDSQLRCSHLRLCGSRIFRQDIVRFLGGFNNLKSITMNRVFDLDEDEEFDPIYLPSLESVAIINSLAGNTASLLEIFDVGEISSLKLDHAVAYGASTDTWSTLAYALREHMSGSDLELHVTHLTIVDSHVQLALVLESIFGSPSSFLFPSLEELCIIAEGESTDESRGLLAASLRSTLSNRSAQDAEMLKLRAPTCMRSIEADLAQAVLTLTWEPCICEGS